MSEKDHIGVVRAHRWASVAEQRRRLTEDGCRTIVELDGKRDAATREELEILTRPTTTIKIVHAFLLADPRKRRKKGGMKADFLKALKRLVCKPPSGRGGTLKDVDTGLTTADQGHKQAIIALAYAMLARDGKGLKSKLNGAKSTKGRTPKDFPADVKAKAEVFWFDKRLKTWDDVRAKLRPLGVSTDRAYDWFGKRNKD